MDTHRFWRWIDEARLAADGDCDRLTDVPPAEIVAFQRALDDRLAESYTWDLWAAAYIINGGCSDDGFDYFRGWLIALGRARVSERAARPGDAD